MSPSPTSPTPHIDAGRPTHVVAIGLALLVTVLWSSSWILIRWGLDDESLEPLGFAALRYGLAAGVLLAWVGGQPRLRTAVRGLDRSQVGWFVLLGLLFYAATQGAQFVAIDSQPAATTSLLLSATPLLVAAMSGTLLGETPSARQILGGVLVVGGATLYLAGSLGATVVGMIAATIGLLANASSSVLGRHVNRAALVPSVVVTALSMAVGSVVLGGVSLAVEGLPSVSARAWLIIAWLAVVNTAVANTMWNISLRRLSAVESAGINNTMLLQIGLLAWWFLDEAPGVAGLIGMVLVSAGVLTIQVTGRRPTTAARPRLPRRSYDVRP